MRIEVGKVRIEEREGDRSEALERRKDLGEKSGDRGGEVHNLGKWCHNIIASLPVES